MDKLFSIAAVISPIFTAVFMGILARKKNLAPRKACGASSNLL